MFNIFVNDLNSGAECSYSEFASNTKVGRVVDTPDGVLPFRGTWTDWNTGQRGAS